MHAHALDVLVPGEIGRDGGPEVSNAERSVKMEDLKCRMRPHKVHPNVVKAEVSEARQAQSDSSAELKKRNHDSENEIVAKPCQIVTS